MPFLIVLKRAVVGDANALAVMNRLMIEDEGYKGRISLRKLTSRMKSWLRSGEYEAVFFLDEDDSKVGYALFQKRQNALYFARRQVFLRHFFVTRDYRKRGIGTEAFKALKEEFWGGAHRVDLQVLIKNRRAVRFWHSLGFKEYQFSMELDMPEA
jgi:RimJ/RimL family protein N-acetyltransferase